MKYDVDYFIAKFEEIPEELWCVYSQSESVGNKIQHCAYGWCLPNPKYNKTQGGERTEEGKKLHELINTLPILTPALGNYNAVAPINNGDYDEYQQPTPKQRILAALYDIREKELSEANLKAATIIVNTETKILNYEV